MFPTKLDKLIFIFISFELSKLNLGAFLLLDKKAIREEVWRLMEESGVSRFPKPVAGRIPNFEGSEIAARRLVGQPEFQSARVVKVNPDSPQTHVRRSVLLSGKLLIMPTPRLRKGFILLDPRKISKRFFAEASTIRGAFNYGRLCSFRELPMVDLIVAGSVAVSRDGVRIGKGGGYSEIEYGVLRDLNLIDEDTPIFTTVHDVQIIDKAPKEEHDFIVDAIITPTRVARIERKYSQPKGIIWEKITKHQMKDIPTLKELKTFLIKENKGVRKFEGRTVTAIIEFPDDRILLVKRGTIVFKGFWALPGGRVKVGETIEQAVVREVKEETGLNVEIVGKIGEYHESGFQDGITYDYYPACFLVKPIGGKIERPEMEIEKIRLFEIKDVPERLAFAHSRMISDYMRSKRREISPKV